MKAKVTIWVGNALVILVWPTGLLFGEMLGKGQDPAGAGMAAGIGLFLALAVVYPPVAIVLAIVGKRNWAQFSKLNKFLSIGPAIVCSTGIFLVVGLFAVEIIYGLLH